MLNSILFLALFFIIMIAALFIVTRVMMRRAIKQVVEAFRVHNAWRAENAKTQGELGLNPLTFAQRITKTRDYKPMALRMLVKEGVIILTDDGRMYIVEEKMNEFLKTGGWK